jgi:hypothetical protein
MSHDHWHGGNFTREQAGAYGLAKLEQEAKKLLFDTTPFELIPSLDETLKRSFEQCMAEESVPVAAGAEAVGEAHDKALETCSLKTGYRP